MTNEYDGMVNKNIFYLHGGVRFLYVCLAVICALAVIGIPFSIWVLYRISKMKIDVDSDKISVVRLTDKTFYFKDVVKFTVCKKRVGEKLELVQDRFSDSKHVQSETRTQTLASNASASESILAIIIVYIFIFIIKFVPYLFSLILNRDTKTTYLLIEVKKHKISKIPISVLYDMEGFISELEKSNCPVIRDDIPVDTTPV